MFPPTIQTGAGMKSIKSGQRASIDGTWKVADCNAALLGNLNWHIANTCKYQA